MNLYMKRVLFVLAVTGAMCYSATVEKVRTFNEGGRFCMVFEVVNELNCNVTAFMKNRDGQIVTRWNDRHYNAGRERTFTFDRDFSSMPSGRYTMVVIVKDYYGNGSTTWTGEIVHQPVSTFTHTGTKTVRMVDGSYGHRFLFKYTGCRGKVLNVEIQTRDGKSIKKIAHTVSKSDKGEYSWIWDYIPENGIRVPNGSYILKYWVGDEPWKQTLFII